MTAETPTTPAARAKVTFKDLLVLAAKSGLTALYLLALVAGLRRHDWQQTFILLAPLGVGAVWHYRQHIVRYARALEHSSNDTQHKETTSQ